MSEAKYWVWLSEALGAGARVDEIFGAFSSPRSIYEAGRTERAVSGVFSKAKLDRLDNTKLSDAETHIEICRKNGKISHQKCLVLHILERKDNEIFGR